MIKVKEKTFILETDNTSYVFFIDEINHLEHLYYGKKLTTDENLEEQLKEKTDFAHGNSIAFDEEHPNSMLEGKILEYSSMGHGDVRNPMVDITLSNGSRSLDFTYKSHEIRKHTVMESLPTSYGNEDTDELCILLEDKENNIEQTLIYTPYEKENVIARRTEIKNLNKEEIKVTKAMSLQLDMPNKNFNLISFHGVWAKEMKKYVQPLVIGTYNNESQCGISSSRSNPFVMLASSATTEDSGEVYGFNLLYSGNHLESCEIDPLDHLRFLSGINPSMFSYALKENETFYSPEAIMSFAENGFNSLSHNMHDFVRNHIVKGKFQDLPRPVLNNSWEAAYFKFNERKLLKMAKKAAKAGVELFVLDDGWFGTRNDDTQSLGDWYVNTKKLPHGIQGLSHKIKAMGMQFGIWVEPEMVNENSDLFRAHPEWVVKIPDRKQSLGRHQYILDLSCKDVVDYLYDCMCKVFSDGEVSYVKWDMNRIFSDYYSNFLDREKMGEFSYRYYVGLYDLMGRLIKKFPDVLFEGCASGGSRFDLGILSYFPQIWASDNSDAFSRVFIQEGYSYGYPMSTLGCHVSDTPNHQTFRNADINSRYNVAFLGSLGYEFNFNEISKDEYNACVRQIKEYKEYRKYFFDSDFYRKESKDGNHLVYAVSKDKEHAVAINFTEQASLYKQYNNLPVKGLNDDYTYHVHSTEYIHDIRKFGSLINQVAPFHIKKTSVLVTILSKFIKMKEKGADFDVNGSVINNNGLEISQYFGGTGWNENVRVLVNNDSRMYFFNKK